MNKSGFSGLFVVISLFIGTLQMFVLAQENERYLHDSEIDLLAMSSETVTTEISTVEPENNPHEDLKSLNHSKKISCFPFSEKLEFPNDNENSKAEFCRKLGCEWYPRGSGKNWQSYCFTPKKYGYYGGIVKGLPKPHDWGYELILDRKGLTMGLETLGKEDLTYFGNDSDYLRMIVEFQSDDRIHVKITVLERLEDEEKMKLPKWEVPLPIYPPKKSKSSRLYDVEFEYFPVFSFKVIRKSSGTVIFDTSVGGFTFSDQFIQIATKLPSQNLYGFGEHDQPSFKHNFDELDVIQPGAGHSKIWPMFSREIGSTSVPFTNFGGVHPQYTIVEPDGNCHSVMFLNSNAQEIQLLPIPGLIYRSIGGVLDFYIFMGSTPEATVQQYTEAIGRPFLPPYYSLGFHISSSPFASFSDLKEMIKKVQQAEIPFDVIHGGLEILDDYKSFTLNEKDFKDLPKYVNQLQEPGLHFSVQTNPLISNDNESHYFPLVLGNEMNIWVNDNNGSPVQGYYELTGDVLYPDFSKPSATFWWKSVLENYKKMLNFDGINLDRNEPYNFGTEDCPDNRLNNPPYIPKIRGSLADGTICPSSVHFGGSHYDYHSLYGLKQSEITYKTLIELDNNKRPFITSKSTYLGSGQWVGHFLQNSHGTWHGLQLSIIKMLQFNQFGIPFVGSNICSFTDLEEVSEELCLRWIQLGAFYPLARTHNEKLAQDLDPAAFNETTTKLIKKAIQVRYSLLPYLYTLFYKAHVEGNAVVRSVWHEYPKDPITYDIDRQFFWGRSLMIIPILESGVTSSVEAYVPKDRWYDFRTHEEIFEKGTHVNIDAKQDTIPVLIRGYSVIPIQEPGMNTKMSRNNPFSLIIALCPMGNGEGQLYYDDGIPLDAIKSETYFLAHYKVQNKTLTASVKVNGYAEMSSKIITTIQILGAGEIQEIQLNNQKYEDWKTNPKTAETHIANLNLAVNSNFTIRWINWHL